MVENFQPDPASAVEFWQFHQSSSFNQPPLTTISTAPNLIEPPYNPQLQLFEFGFRSPTESHFPVSNEPTSSSHHPFHDLTPQSSPSHHWSPSQQPSPNRSFSPDSEERATARAAKLEEIQRQRAMAEEAVQKLKRLEEEAAQADDIDFAATLALAQAAQHL